LKSYKQLRADIEKLQARPGAGMAKYRDPKSGRTWTGFGRVPDWLASAKDREAFLIGRDKAPQAAAQPEPEATTSSRTARSIR
jgi:hypothetical protein